MVNIVKAETYSCDCCMRLYWSNERAEICEKEHKKDIDSNKVETQGGKMRTKKEIEDEIEKLRKCCEWNGWNMKTTPDYKDLKKELKKCIKHGENKQ